MSSPPEGLTPISPLPPSGRLTSSTIIGTQFVMALVSRLVGAKNDAKGHHPLLLISFGALLVHILLLALSSNKYCFLNIQLLDGLGEGIIDTLLPLVVRDVIRGGDGRLDLIVPRREPWGIGAVMSSSITGGVMEYTVCDVTF